MNRRQEFAQVAVLVTLAVGLAEVVSYGTIAVVSPRLDAGIVRVRSIYAAQSRQIALRLDPAIALREQIDSVLGWRYRPGFTSATDTIDAQGLCAGRECRR